MRHALPQLDREPERSTGASPGSATSACRSRSGTRSTPTARPTTSARSWPRASALPVDPTVGRAARLREAQRDQPGGFSGRARRLRHLVHELAHAADRLALGARTRAAHARSSRPTSGRRATRSSAPGRSTRSRRRCCTSGTIPWHARRHLRLDPRPRPQEDVEEQGQRRDADAPARRVRRRRRALLGGSRAARHRHRVRREGLQGRQAPGDEALQRGKFVLAQSATEAADHARARSRVRWRGCASWSRARRALFDELRLRARARTRPSASSGAASPTPTSSS